jgi:hypothetical protein
MSCRVPYCNSPTSRWGNLCNTHRARQRRHGHPKQRAVTKAELAHYVQFVRKRKARNPESPFWGSVAGRWAGLVEHARGVTGAYYSGKPMIGWEVKACASIVKIAGNVEAQAVVDTALGMYVMLEMEDPRRFLSDEAFRFQLVRRIRGLTEVNAGEWYDHKTGRTKRAYRDLSPRTTGIMADLLVRTFGAPGVMLAKREAEDLAKGKQNVAELGDAVRALQ